MMKQIEEYSSLGWRLIPIARATKRPLVDKWPERATFDAETIADWWERWPEANVAIVLGQASGLIDIEIDDDEDQADFDRLFEGVDQNEMITPSFRSARGTHRLFRWTAEIPQAAMSGAGKWGAKLAIRAGSRCYSVFPPSVHESGRKYEWLIPPGVADVAPLPELVLARLALPAGDQGPDRGGSGVDWSKIEAGVGEGERNEAAARLAGRYLGELADLADGEEIAAAWLRLRGWNLDNRPPLDEPELRRTFESILGAETAARATNGKKTAQTSPRREKASQAAGEGSERGATKIPGLPEDIRLVIIDSSKPVFVLISESFRQAVELTPAQFYSFHQTRTAIAAKCLIQIPKQLSKKWEKVTGTLLSAAELRPPGDDVELWDLIGQILVEMMDEAPESDVPKRSMVRIGRDLLFRYEWLVDELSRRPFKIDVSEFGRFLNSLGVESRQLAVLGGGRPKFRLISPDCERRIRSADWNLASSLGCSPYHARNEKTREMAERPSRSTEVDRGK